MSDISFSSKQYWIGLSKRYRFRHSKIRTYDQRQCLPSHNLSMLAGLKILLIVLLATRDKKGSVGRSVGQFFKQNNLFIKDQRPFIELNGHTFFVFFSGTLYTRVRPQFRICQKLNVLIIFLFRGLGNPRSQVPTNMSVVFKLRSFCHTK